MESAGSFPPETKIVPAAAGTDAWIPSPRPPGPQQLTSCSQGTSSPGNEPGNPGVLSWLRLGIPKGTGCHRGLGCWLALWNVLLKPPFDYPLLQRPILKSRVLIGKKYEFYSGGWPPGEKVNSCPKANSKVSSWPSGFFKELRIVNQ